MCKSGDLERKSLQQKSGIERSAAETGINDPKSDESTGASTGFGKGGASVETSTELGREDP
jgi:hypothetical protein